MVKAFAEKVRGDGRRYDVALQLLNEDALRWLESSLRREERGGNWAMMPDVLAYAGEADIAECAYDGFLCSDWSDWSLWDDDIRRAACKMLVVGI